MTSSETALKRLTEGNAAYIAGERPLTGVKGQHPYAVIVSCADSRVPPEYIFSAGPGDIFVIRTAGNVVDEIALGSVAYGVKQFAVPLVLVMGHTDCGAVAAAVKGDCGGSIASVTAKIRACIGSETDLSKCEKLNVLNTVKEIGEDGIVAGLMAEGKVEVHGAIYDIGSGRVELVS